MGIYNIIPSPFFVLPLFSQTSKKMESLQLVTTRTAEGERMKGLFQRLLERGQCIDQDHFGVIMYNDEFELFNWMLGVTSLDALEHVRGSDFITPTFLVPLTNVYSTRTAGGGQSPEDQLHVLVRQTPVDCVKLEQLLNENTFTKYTLIPAAHYVIRHRGLKGFEVLFDKIDPSLMIRLVMFWSNLEEEQFKRSMKRELNRGAAIDTDEVGTLLKEEKFQQFKWTIQVIPVDMLWQMMSKYARFSLTFVHPMVDMYLTKVRGPVPITELSVKSKQERAYKALGRYVHTFRERETLFIFAVVTKRPRNTKTKLPLDLVKKLGVMVLGSIRLATAQEIEDEGRYV